MKTSNDISNLLSLLLPGKGQRASDLVPEFPGYGERELEECLDELVIDGHAEKYVHFGEKYYLKKM